MTRTTEKRVTVTLTCDDLLDCAECPAESRPGARVGMERDGVVVTWLEPLGSTE